MIQRKNVEITKTYAFLKISHISILILMLFSTNLFADNSTDGIYKISPSVNMLDNKNMPTDSIPNFIFGYYKDKTPYFSYVRNTSQYHFYIDEEWIYTQKHSYKNQKVNTFMNFKTNDVFSAYPDEIIGFGENTIITTYNNESVSLWSFTGELKYELKDFSTAKLEYPDNPNKGWMIDKAYFIDPFIIIEGEVINLPYFQIAHINNQPPVIIDTRTDEAFFAPYGYHLFAVPTKE